MACKVLIVEDNPLIARMWSSKLASANCEVRTAADGRSARIAVVEWKPDVVLLDVLLPETDGLMLCREWRRSHSTRGMKIIVVSAFGSGKDIEAAFAAGADDYLAKSPATAGLLVPKLNEWLLVSAGLAVAVGGAH